MKYVITSPAFSEFRAGEPQAYRIAEKILNEENNMNFTRSYTVKRRTGNQWETAHIAKVTAKGDMIEVVLKEGEEPFVFNVEEL